VAAPIGNDDDHDDGADRIFGLMAMAELEVHAVELARLRR